MFCRNCGKELIGTPEICPNCGAKPMSGTGFCSNCGAPITPLTEICMKCGARVAITRYPIGIEIEHPEKLSRLTTFFRFFMAIPHYFVLYFIGIAAGVVVFISWWAILFTGRYPRWAFDFVSGYFRWNTRVGGYSLLLTDKYPPFSFQ
jgi:RNA polymerase subunit RPABC4/transcription elongation factor Spt4